MSFARKRPPKPDRSAEFANYTPPPLPCAVYDGKARATVPVPKEQPTRDEDYRRLVAALPCAHCGIEGYTQAAHGDMGKGLAIKACDSTCFPLCGPKPTLFGTDPGCHWLFGTSGRLKRDERRELEQRYAAQTRQRLGRE